MRKSLMPTILLTGFEPFADVAVNPAQLLAEQLDGADLAGARIVGRVLPVVFGADAALVAALVREHDPVAVLSLGVAVGTDRLRIETLARNLRQSPDGPIAIVANAPAACTASIPVFQVYSAIRAAGAPVCLGGDGDAGDFLCNHVLYTTLRLAHACGGRFRAGFIHLPALTGHAPPGKPAMPLETMARGVRTALAVIAGAMSPVAV